MLSEIYDFIFESEEQEREVIESFRQSETIDAIYFTESSDEKSEGIVDKIVKFFKYLKEQIAKFIKTMSQKVDDFIKKRKLKEVLSEYKKLKKKGQITVKMVDIERLADLNTNGYKQMLAVCHEFVRKFSNNQITFDDASKFDQKITNIRVKWETEEKKILSKEVSVGIDKAISLTEKEIQKIEKGDPVMDDLAKQYDQMMNAVKNIRNNRNNIKMPDASKCTSVIEKVNSCVRKRRSAFIVGGILASAAVVCGIVIKGRKTESEEDDRPITLSDIGKSVKTIKDSGIKDFSTDQIPSDIKTRKDLIGFTNKILSEHM